MHDVRDTVVIAMTSHLQPIIEHITTALYTNDKLAMSCAFVKLRLLQDHLHGKHLWCGSSSCGGDGIDWPIESCPACGGAR